MQYVTTYWTPLRQDAAPLGPEYAGGFQTRKPGRSLHGISRFGNFVAVGEFRLITRQRRICAFVEKHVTRGVGA